MQIKIAFNDKEKHILKRILAITLSIEYMLTGIVVVTHFNNTGILTTQWELVPAIALHFFLWGLVTDALFKHYK